MVLLINPKLTSTPLNRHLEALTFNSMPIGLGFLSVYLKSKGVQNRIIDEQLTDISDIFIKMEINRMDDPKIIGISVLTGTYKRACQIAKIIKGIDPSVFVVIGGIHPTATAEECLKDSFFDIVVRGEGEETLYETVLALKNKTCLSAVMGISYKMDNKVIHNPDRPLLMNLDDIPPFPYYLFEDEIKRYKEFGIIVTSRGCPYKCIFCSSRLISGYKYRTHSIGRVINDIDLLINKYKQTSLSFLDDNIACDKKRFSEIVDIIMAKGFHEKARFYIGVRGKDMDDDLCRKLKAANFEVAVNFEAGTNRILKLIKKGETVEDNIAAVLKAKKHGINVTSVFIFGFPTENEQDRRKAICLSRKLPIDSARFNIAVPYPGTELYDIAKSTNRLNVKGLYENFAVQQYIENDDLPFILPSDEKGKVIFDVFWANLSFYLRPVFLVRNLLKKNFAGHAISFNFDHPFLLFKELFALAIIFTRRFIMISINRFFIWVKTRGCHENTV